MRYVKFLTLTLASCVVAGASPSFSAKTTLRESLSKATGSLFGKKAEPFQFSKDRSELKITISEPQPFPFLLEKLQELEKTEGLNVVKLSLSLTPNPSWTQENAMALGNALAAFRNLKTLHLEDLSLGKHGLPLIEAFKDHKKLHELHLERNALDKSTAIAIATVLANTRIFRHLYLNENGFDPKKDGDISEPFQVWKRYNEGESTWNPQMHF